MNAQINHWCVTFYLDKAPDSREVLQRIYEVARTLEGSLKLSVGTVGILSVPKDPTTVCFVSLTHCGRRQAETVLKEAGISLAEVIFESVSVTTPEWKTMRPHRATTPQPMAYLP